MIYYQAACKVVQVLTIIPKLTILCNNIPFVVNMFADAFIETCVTRVHYKLIIIYNVK